MISCLLLSIYFGTHNEPFWCLAFGGLSFFSLILWVISVIAKAMQ